MAKKPRQAKNGTVVSSAAPESPSMPEEAKPEAKAKAIAGKQALATNATKKSPQVKQQDKTPKLSALDAAAKILGETGQPMNCRDLVEQMSAKGYWTTPSGKTPHATLNAAISREIHVKGADSRFTKADRGQFARKG
jgi:hypothetical protein